MVIGGVWDLRDEADLSAAMAEAEHVDAYCLGHTGLQKRYLFSELEAAVPRVRQATGRPVAVSELVADYETNQRLVSLGDFGSSGSQ